MQQSKPQTDRRQSRPQLQRRTSRHNNTPSRNSLAFVNQVSPKQYTAEQVLMLQRTVGNQATIKILRQGGVIQRDVGDGTEENETQLQTTEEEDLTTLDVTDTEVQKQDEEIQDVQKESSDLGNTLKNPSTSSNSQNIEDNETSLDDIDDADLGFSRMIFEDTDERYVNSFDKELAYQNQHGPNRGGRSHGVGSKRTIYKDLGTSVATDTNIMYQAVQAGKQLKSGIDVGAQQMSAVGSQVAEGGMTAFQAVMGTLGNFALPIATLIYRINGVRAKGRQMRAFRKLAKDAGASKEDFKRAKKASSDLEQDAYTNRIIGAYAYNKTRRGFWLRVARVAISVGQIISRLITLLSLGTAAIVSESVNLALGLADGAGLLVRSMKGFFKAIFGKRGKRRAAMGFSLYAKARRGEREALQTLIDSGFPDKQWMAIQMMKRNTFDTKRGDKQQYQQLVFLATRPKTTGKMQKYLEIADAQGLRTETKRAIANFMKST